MPHLGSIRCPPESRGGHRMAAQDGAGERRRTRSLDERKRIVEEALTPGVSVAAVARRHGLNANLVFKWIRCSREGWLYRRREPGGQPCRGRATREGQIGLRPLELHRRSRQCSAQRKLCKPGSPLKKSDCGHQTSLQAKIQTFRRSCFFVFTREPRSREPRTTAKRNSNLRLGNK